MISLTRKTKVLVQGITGREGKFWTEQMVKVGTNVVAGVTPGKGGQVTAGVPVFNWVEEAVAALKPEASILFVPPRLARDAAIEAISAGIKLVVLLADGVPLRDAMEIRYYARAQGSLVLGPNTPGCARVGETMLGFIPTWLPEVYKPGKVGIIARSGSLTNEVSSHILRAGLGISSLIGVGGDAAPCTRMADLLPYFIDDPQTEAMVVIGEVGGSMEEELAAELARSRFAKSSFAFIAGRSAPPGKKMGHAGAIMEPGRGTVINKIEALQNAGVKVARRPSEIANLLC